MKLVSKGNWRNFYGIDKWSIFEVLKVSWNYYRAKYVTGEWLRAVGNPIKRFTLVSNKDEKN